MAQTRRGLLRGVLHLAAAGCALAAGHITSAAAAYPERPVTVIVPFAAGGGTDATARILATLLEKELGQPFNVVNRPGGSGVVGHTAIAQAAPNGYTIGIATTELNSYKPLGLADLNPASYTPIALYNFDPAAVHVPTDSKFKKLSDLLDALKKNETVRISTGGPLGGSWHTGFGLLLVNQKINPSKVTFVPSNGAAPGLQEMIAGGVDVTTSSLPEAKALIDSGKVRSLGVVGPVRLAAFPDVPTTKEAVGVEVMGGAWRAVLAPKGLPADVRDRLASAMEKVVATDEFKKFMNDRGFGTRWAVGGDLDKFLSEQETSLGETLKAIGLAK
jgi:tripartite-type tricarboxylate transporter receptor subunit TctC